MPAPKRPNTAEATRRATEARIRRGQETQAEKLRAAGWVVIPPEDADKVNFGAGNPQGQLPG